ncbi:TIM-barrel domain-containing protein [Simiduia aestuariiviva]|uniref:Oligosaccharide 4-alpha-D-glucosyltransferase n=1 Tax=Simiduia aestuariiviva TaxID=1510459 RepID=A0A839UP65_9GAMM|nr:TIM-barrel domain-containing protein [Simiduia aestuariiviva]MBB3169632.1 oligosaccharide 4-alpha-D-glucosyltransferase [Simiduia aestuariiviva]
MHNNTKSLRHWRRHVLALLLPLSVITPQSYADFGNYQSHSLTDTQLTIITDEGQLKIAPQGDHALEVHYAPTGVAQLPSFALPEQRATASALSLKNFNDRLELTSQSLKAIIQKHNLTIAYEFKNKPLVAEEAGLFVQDSLRGFRFALTHGEKIIGGGQRVMGMDRRGQRMPLYNKAHYGYKTQSNQMYYSLPAVLSTNKYLLVFDNSASGNLDIGATESDVLQFEAVGGRTSYLIVAGESYPSLIENYTLATGRQPLPPRWAFGNFASRFGYRTEQEVRDTLAAYREHDFPVDALVLDLYWFGKDIKGHMGNLEWDRKAFPNPTAMMADLKKAGVKTVLITEPFILTSSSRWQEAVENDVLAQNAAGKPKTFNFYFGNTGLIDVFHRPAQHWFWSVYQNLMLQGVDGWWGDLGEPEVHPDDTLHRLPERVAAGSEVHNVYGHQWAKLVYDQQRKHFPDTRPLVMMRAGFAGSQRFGFIPWTGDVARSWAGLKPQVELSLQMSLLGLAYTHSDLGGFAGGETFDQELYVRWLQYGVFQPVYRPHAQDNIAPEPVFHDQTTRDLVRPFVKLRYQLFPYNYTLAYENSTRGMPLMRPLFFEDESAPALIDNSTSYLWGDAFLVTPVTEAGIKSVSVQLPKGVWFDYFSGQRYRGGQIIEQPTELATLPVLVRAGSFIPMVAATQSTRDYDSSQLTLHYYHDKTVERAHGKMYEDDGRNPNALRDGQFELLSFNAKQLRNRLDISLSHAGGYSGQPPQRNIKLVVHNQSRKPRRVALEGESVPFAYDGDAQRLIVPFNWQHQNLTVSIH